MFPGYPGGFVHFPAPHILYAAPLAATAAAAAHMQHQQPQAPQSNGRVPNSRRHYHNNC
jgi:hypothetical protein